MKSHFSVNTNRVIFFTKLICFETVWTIPMENQMSSYVIDKFSWIIFQMFRFSFI